MLGITLYAVTLTAPVILGLLAIFIGPLVTYLVAKRKLSGKINTSEASSLWDEAGKLRAEYKEEVAALRVALRECEARVAHVEDRNRIAALENESLRKRIELNEETIAALRKQVAVLSAENEALRAENVKLRTRVEELEAANGKTH